MARDVKARSWKTPATITASPEFLAVFLSMAMGNECERVQIDRR